MDPWLRHRGGPCEFLRPASPPKADARNAPHCYHQSQEFPFPAPVLDGGVWRYLEKPERRRTLPPPTHSPFAAPRRQPGRHMPFGAPILPREGARARPVTASAAAAAAAARYQRRSSDGPPRPAGRYGGQHESLTHVGLRVKDGQRFRLSSVTHIWPAPRVEGCTPTKARACETPGGYSKAPQH